MKISAKLSGQQEGRYKKLWAQACQSPHLSVRLEEVKDSENNRKDKLFEYRKGAYSTKVRNILIKGLLHISYKLFEYNKFAQRNGSGELLYHYFNRNFVIFFRKVIKSRGYNR